MKTKSLISFILALLILASCFAVTSMANEEEHVHSYTVKSTVPATCTSSGEIVYVCTCGATYTEYTNPTGHKMVYHKEVEPTCTKTGVREHWHCTNCNKDFDDAKGNYVLNSDDLELSKLTHMFASYGKTITATCFNSGVIAGEKCINCGKISKKPVNVKKKTFKIKKTKRIKKGFVVIWPKTKAANGFEIKYSVKKSLSNAKKKISSKYVKYIKVTKLKSKKTYYVKARAYKKSKGKKIYSNWSKIKAVKTK